MAEIQTWYHGLPPVTKWFFSLSVGATLLGTLGVFPAEQAALILDSITKEFQVWRLVSTYIFHMLSLSFVMNMMFLLRFGQNLERVKFAGRSADFLWMIVICSIVLLIPGFGLRIGFLAGPLIMSIIYVWARSNAETTVTFMFGLSFKAKYLPWAMAAFTALVGGNPMADIFGIVAGHVYFLLAELVPRDYGWNLVRTPQFVCDWFPEDRATAGPQGFGQAPRVPQQDAGPRVNRYDWGSGQRLGQ